MAKARDLESYWDLVLKALAINGKDAPFALLYATDQDAGPVASTISSPGSVSELDRCILKSSIGVDAGHPIADVVINFKDGTNIFIPYLLKAAKSRKPTLLHFEELTLAPNMLENIRWEGYGDPCRCLVICPILPTTSEQVLGFLILGVNPRRPFDTEYQQFITVMSRLLATSLASVVLLDEEIRQKENAIGQAARLQEQLLAEIKQKERKFTRWAEKSDIAIFIMDPVGKYTYRSDRWFEIFEIAAEQADVVSVWDNIVFPEDIPVCEGLFHKLAVDKVAISFELKTKMRWVPPGDQAEEEGDDSQPYYKWILCSAYPEVNQNDELLEIVGNVTDISEQKWAEGVQKHGKDTALESKKHLEHFIDTTSHEMRNPLSAIMQCADGILSSYSGAATDSAVPSPGVYSTLLEQTLDAAQTIAQCAQHMKRIVDDILTISKLDSGLLVITPIEAQPESVAKHAVKMFEAEAKAAGVDMALVIERSYRDLAINWVSLDPTRLLQVCTSLRPLSHAIC
jgi:PAS domain-containing protein